MDVSRRKTWINIAATLLVALALFAISYNLAAAQTTTIAAPAGPAPDGSYGIGDVATQLDLSGISRYLFMAIAGIGSLIAWLGGMLMDLSIGFFTVGMVDAMEKLGLKVAVTEMWSIIRDIFNLLFIFGLIFAGFKIILGADDSASKKTVGMIVLAALLINFSLYATQVVVDFTNVAAYQIHQMINPGTAASKSMLGIPINNVSNQFYLITGLSENRGDIDAELAPVSGGVDQFLKALILGFVFLIFYTILGFVFAACAIILFTRFFALIFLMIFSPLMFLGWVLPSMKDTSSKWWKYFSNQALVGPALLFMIYLSLRALQGLGTTNREGTFIATIVYLLVVVAFLFASLKVAKSFGAYGTQMAINMGNSARGSVQGFVGRNTVGRFAEQTLKQLDRDAATGSQSRAAKAFRSVLDNRTVRGALESGKKSKFGGKFSLEDDKKYVEEKNKRVTADRAAINREQALDTGIRLTDPKSPTPPDAATMKAVATAMKELTEKQLTEDLDVKILTNQNIAVHLTEKNIETLEKSGKRSEEDMKAIKAARKQGLIDIARNGTDEHGVPLTRPTAYNPERNAEWLATKGTDEVAKMPVEVFTAPSMAPYLTPTMVEAKMKSGLSNTEIESIRQRIDDQLSLNATLPPTPTINAYGKQWKTWSERTSVGARLGLQNLP